MAAIDIFRIALTGFANTTGLKWGEDSEFDTEFRQDFQCRRIRGGFREPHPFRGASEPVFEITDAPKHLCVFITWTGERENHVVIDLCQGRAVPGIILLTQFVRGDNCLVDVWHFIFHPRQEGRAEVETDFRVIADDLLDPSFSIENPSGGIGSVTFHGDTFVPIVVRGRRIL